VALSDHDGDGRAELGFGYFVGLRRGDATVKQLWLRGRRQVHRPGRRPGAGEPEPAAARWPAAALAATMAAFDANAAALDVAGRRRAVADDTVYDADSPLPQVERTEQQGGVEYRVSYPTLPMLGRGDAAVVTATMRQAVDATARHPRHLRGTHEGDCELGLINREIMSVHCRRMVSLWTQAELDQGIGGAPAGPLQVGFTWWRSPGRAEVTLAELGAPDRAAARGSSRPTACAGSSIPPRGDLPDRAGGMGRAATDQPPRPRLDRGDDRGAVAAGRRGRDPRGRPRVLTPRPAGPGAAPA
jgi:hypothetical protein